MGLTQLGQFVVSPSFTVTPEFMMYPLWKRIGYVVVSGKVVLYKYMGVWLMNEGGCVLSGITFKGWDATTRQPLWNGLSNVNVWLLETATSFSDIIAGFNMNTNLWTKQYIFKRLRFLGNHHISD